MSDPETSGQFVTRQEFSRIEARLDDILHLTGREKTRMQDGATGLDKEDEIAALKAEISKHKQEKERQRNLLQKRESEIATLEAKIGKHKQERVRQKNLLLSQSLEHEKAKEDMEALRREMVMTTERAKNEQKMLQQEREKLIAETASLKTRLEQEKSTEEIAVIQGQLKETQQRLNHLEEELGKVREKHEEKITALDNHLKSLLTNQAHQNLMEERTDIHSHSCSVYDEEILTRVRTLFVQHIIPLNVLHLFHQYNTKILTQHDIEKVTAVTKNHGKFVGAAELLSSLVRYKHWFPCLLQVLRDPLIKQEHVANGMEEILAQDPVVNADTNNVMDEDNVEEHHGTESQEISRLHRHMELLEMALTTYHSEISQANTDKNEVRNKLDKLENHIQKVETSHSHELEQKEERLASLEKLTQQTQSNMTKEIKDLQKTFKVNMRKIKLELDTKVDHIDEEFRKTQKQNMATIKEQASKLGNMEKKLKKMKEEEKERWSQVHIIHKDVETLKDAATDEQIQELIQTGTATSRSVDELTSKVEDTERSVRGFVAQHERDENRRREMEDRVAVLEARRQEDLDHYTKELEETHSQYKVVCKLVDDRVTPLRRLQRMLNDYHKQVEKREEISTRLDDVVKKAEDISTQLDKLERSVVPARVGFTAYHPKCDVPSEGSRITNFTKVFYNEGKHYNSSRGEFICPVDGLYVVSTTISQDRDGVVDVEIRHQCNTATQSREVCRAKTDLADTSCCGVAVVRLTHGDRVYVEVYRKSGRPVLNSYSSFSCFQIG